MLLYYVVWVAWREVDGEGDMEGARWYIREDFKGSTWWPSSHSTANFMYFPHSPGQTKNIAELDTHSASNSFEHTMPICLLFVPDFVCIQFSLITAVYGAHVTMD